MALCGLFGVGGGGECYRFPDVEAVGGADFGWDFHGEALSFDGAVDRAEINADFVDGQQQCSGRGSGDHNFVADFYLATFNIEFGDSEVGEIADSFGCIAFDACGARAVFA